MFYSHEILRSKHISESRPIVLDPYVQVLLLRFPNFALAILTRILSIEPTILPYQQNPKSQRYDCDEKHEAGAYTHALDIPRALTGGIEAGAEDGAALADEIDEHKACSPS